MKIPKLLIQLISLFTSVLSYSQARQLTSSFEIPGKIISEPEKSPLPYANIYNRSTQKGTISNYDGFFVVEVNSLSDTLVISYTGYQKKTMIASEIKKNPTIFLRYSTTLLEEVTVLADDSFLYEMVVSCRKKSIPSNKTAKSYFSLNAFIDDKQVEMVESYYNGIFAGYSIDELKMKNGRLAFSKDDENTFLSTETSKALYFLKLFEKMNTFRKIHLHRIKKRSGKNFICHFQKNTRMKNRIRFM